MKDFSLQLKDIPLSPGCYIMRDVYDNIIYIGKSKCLKNRVSQYFHSLDKKEQKIKNLVNNINSIEYIVTDSDLDALMLEYRLIKKHQPVYNSQHKRKRSYVYLRLYLSEEFPSLTISTAKAKDSATYFCISSNIQEADELLRFIADTWRIRTCSKAISADTHSRHCLRYDLGKCCGPCTSGVSTESYIDDTVRPTHSFMRGGKIPLRMLTNRMNLYAENMEYEKAAILRDRLQRLQMISLRIRRLNIGADGGQYLVLVSSHNDKGKYRLFFMSQFAIISDINLTFNNEENKNMIANFIRKLYNVNGNKTVDGEFLAECVHHIHVKRYYISIGRMSRVMNRRLTEHKVQSFTSRIIAKISKWYQKERQYD